MRKHKGYPVYPLTVAQKFHTYYQNFCPKKEVLNIGTSLTIEAELDIDMLKKAIYKAYERCDSMRLRFAADKEGTLYQYVVDKEDRDIEYVDFSAKPWKKLPGYEIPCRNCHDVCTAGPSRILPEHGFPQGIFYRCSCMHQ